MPNYNAFLEWRKWKQKNYIFLNFLNVVLCYVIWTSMVYCWTINIDSSITEHVQTVDRCKDRPRQGAIWIRIRKLIVIVTGSYSRVDKQKNELGRWKSRIVVICNIFTVSDSLTYPDIQTSWYHSGIIKHFEIRAFKMTP